MLRTKREEKKTNRIRLFSVAGSIDLFASILSIVFLFSYCPKRSINEQD